MLCLAAAATTLLLQMQLLVGQALAAEGALREAERHLCDAREWQAAVAMYRDKVGGGVRREEGRGGRCTM
jgi:hypothetical protein